MSRTSARRTLAGFALSLALVAGVAGDGFAKVSGEKAERPSADKVVISWTGKAPVDIYMSERPDAALGDANLVSQGNRTGRFETAVTAARPYYLLKDTGDATIVRVAERVVPLAQGSNFRDLGGYPAANGKHVRWGLLYRSGGTPLLSDADVARVQSLGIKDLIDLRSSEERVLAPTRLDGIRYTAVGYRMPALSGRTALTSMSQVGESYRNFPTMLAPQVRTLFRTLRAAEGPLAYNCTAGQDRTGFATALVLTVLGVPRDVVMADYHLSTVYRHPEYELPKIDATGQPEDSAAFFFASLQKDGRMNKPQPLYDANHRALLEYAFDEMQSRWGGVEGYLNKEVGVTTADIAKLRLTYLE
jgi:protein-tyrosine phosphatase